MIEKTKKHWFTDTAILLALLLAIGTDVEAGRQFPGPAPGKAEGTVRKNQLILENRLISFVWDTSEGRLRPKHVNDKLIASTLQLRETECFQLILEDRQIAKASDLKIVGEPVLTNLEPNSKSARLAEQFGGKQITVMLSSLAPDQVRSNLDVEWRAILRDGSNYVRQQIVLTAKSEPIEVKEIVLLELAAPGAEVMGTVDGSPVAAGNMFFAYEHPLAKSQILQQDLPPPARGQAYPCESRGFRCSLPYRFMLRPGKPLVHSSVVGVVPQGQLRRGFLYYIERERAHPYRPFLHYNSWYDIGYGPEKIQEHQCLEVIELFAKNLIKQRKVPMNSFALDDGWDDTTSLWQFHEGFPNGFSRLQNAAEKYNSALGAWLSPWGGYGQAKQERLKYGREQGFETNEGGFSLAGPRYYARFRDVCVNLIHEYGLNYFKFDGIGVGGKPAGVGAEYAADVEALLQLISELREAKPDVFVNITTGTWPSAYWLWHGDSVWRVGRDWGTFGWGSKRQQQITYRDKETYHNVVGRAPLYPLNSLMTQGIMFANHGLPNEVDGLVQDIQTFFASGTNCQELYITPELLQPEHWDALAEAAKWSGDNADVLVDTHWIGGDPAKGEIYGWASWSKRKGILSLRNPHDKPGQITIDIGKAFELPPGATRKYSVKSPWKSNANEAAIVLSAGEEHTFELKPFEVLVFDAMPPKEV